MLDGHAHGVGEFRRERPGGVGIGVIVEAHVLACQNPRVQYGAAFQPKAVQGGALVRVFAVAQPRSSGQPQRDFWLEGGWAQVRADGGIVNTDVREGFGSQVAPAFHGVFGMPAGVGLRFQVNGAQHVLVILGVDHHEHVGEVLGGGPDHGRAADINVLEGVLEGDACSGHSFAEWVEVDAHQVNRLNAVWFEF